MPSRNNPNVPSKLKRKANRSKVQKRNAGKVTKAKNPRGTAPSSVLHPSSGPAAPLSGKKARKVEKALNHARRRALEAAIAKEGEVIMTDAPKQTKPKNLKTENEGEKMEVDDVS